MTRLKPGNPRQRRPAKDPYRAAAFREAARAIVHKDRRDRQAGFSVDTAGAIGRALERAYAQGFADAQAPASPVPAPHEAAAANSGAAEPVEWVLIPPRPRDAFWTICLFTLGRDPSAMPDGAGRLHPTTMPSGRPGWQLAMRTGREDKPFGQATLLPLVRLGLLVPVQEPDRHLAVGARGQATWRRFLQRGGEFPEDLTDAGR